MKNLSLLFLTFIALFFISAGDEDEDCFDGYSPIKPTSIMGQENVFIFYGFNNSGSNTFMPGTLLNQSYLMNGGYDKISLNFKSESDQNLQGSGIIDGIRLKTNFEADRFVLVSSGGMYMQTGIVESLTEYDSLWYVKDTILHFSDKTPIGGKSLFVGNFDSDKADEFLMLYKQSNQEYIGVFKLDSMGIPILRDSVLLDIDKTPVSCTINDFDQDDENEIVVLYKSSGNIIQAQLIGIDDTFKMEKYSSQMLIETGFDENILHASISSGDYNSDGRQELAFAISKTSSCNAGDNSDCENVFVFPFTINDELTVFNLDKEKVVKYFYMDADGDYKGPAELLSFDLNHNGSDELVLGSQDVIVHSFDENLNLSQSINIGSSGISFNHLSRMMAIADVNGDENEDLIFLDYEFQPSSTDRLLMNYCTIDGLLNVEWSESIDLSQKLEGANNEQNLTLIPGFFAGKFFRIDSCPKYTVREEVSEVIVVLNTPPVHFDVLDGEVYNINDVFNSGESAEKFFIEYTTTSTKGSTNFASTTTSGDWGFQPSFGFDLAASFKDIIGISASFSLDDEEEIEEFQSNSSTHDLIVTESVSQNSFDNRLLTMITNYETWEYLVVDENDNMIGKVHAVRQKDGLTNLEWIESRNVITKGIVLKHEPGNLMSYMEINENANNNTDVKTFIGKGRASFSVGLGGNYSHSLEWADYFNEESSKKKNIVESSPEFGLSVFSSAIGITDGSQGKIEKISTRSVTIGEEMEIKINMHRVINNSYSYSVIPYYYWSINGALVVDYSIGFDQTSDFWQNKYGQKSDPAFIMPFRLDKYKGWDRVDTTIYNLSSSIFFYPGLPNAGDTIDILAQINNFSLKILNSGTEVAFYINDPSDESNRIISVDGSSIATLKNEIEGRNYGYVKMKWAVPIGIDPSETRIFASIDPNNKLDEIHENNNIAWTPLDKSAWKPDVSTVNKTNSIKPILSKKATLEVYPNPVVDFINLKLPKFVVENLYIEVFNMNGILVCTKNISNDTLGNYQLEVSDLPSGIYFIKANTNQGVFSTKFIKQ